MPRPIMRIIALMALVVLFSPAALAQNCWDWEDRESCCEDSPPAGCYPYPSINCGIPCCPWVWDSGDVPYVRVSSGNPSGWSEAPAALDPVVCVYHEVVCVLVVTWQCLSTQDTDEFQCPDSRKPEGEPDCEP